LSVSFIFFVSILTVSSQDQVNKESKTQPKETVEKDTFSVTLINKGTTLLNVGIDTEKDKKLQLEIKPGES
jgi:hypothetical protein